MEVSRTEYTIKRAKELYDNGEDIFIAIDKAREKYEEMIKVNILASVILVIGSFIAGRVYEYRLNLKGCENCDNKKVQI
ncbi:hypothetical protein QC9_1538 [Clostridioides difficile CD39]|nr:hypothetical protein [Clostridioides difficile]EQE49269.1 hypothetical protein QC9_1538 [Clostridioides difficile CD39]